jgi:hypothetical protein
MTKIKKPNVHPRFNRNQSVSGWHRDERRYQCAFPSPIIEGHGHLVRPATFETGEFIVETSAVADVIRGVEAMRVSAAKDVFAIVREVFFSFNDPHRQEAKQKFERLYAKWRDETEHYSRVEKRVLHKAYLSIIGMGPEAIPLILEQMRSEPDDWFSALEAITEENPISEESRGDISEMTEAWLNWGRSRGYVKQRSGDPQTAGRVSTAYVGIVHEDQPSFG